MPQAEHYYAEEIECAPQQTCVNQAREEVRHAARVLTDIEDLNELDFETLELIARSLRRADQHLTQAINQSVVF